MEQNVQKVITLGQDEILAFCGEGDRKLRQIQSRMKARVVARGNELRVIGSTEEVDRAFEMINELLQIQRSHHQPLSDQQVQLAATHYESGREGSIREVFLDTIPVPLKRRHVAPLTATQKIYIDAIRRHDVVFGTGPAGTGKTYLAVAMAVSKLIAGDVGRIILVRPAVEAGESLGFLPGDLRAKLDPYLRPLTDALYEMLDADRLRQFIEDGIIEIAPLAYMRGRTLNNSFIILDEAQNTSIEQMKMFLTRLGLDSQAVITGDPTQIDLPKGRTSGLLHVQKILAGVDGIDFIHFSGNDVVRHALVQKIIRAYETHGQG
ncbi:MAG TPA: PhoH family protein [Candidatus Sumerlaeota bacterium]|nr:PhoH family protein [Candidatus Sumerlaeota bacterium]HOR27712.1 PhoH family protein [Candidatus Sumerlaeota bacterium]HPK03281.1 PhoH family protein [Candidatus Sumerlaeota bacterium]